MNWLRCRRVEVTEDDLQCSRLLIVCQRERGLSDEEDTRLE